MTTDNKPKQEAYTLEEIEAVYEGDAAFLTRDTLLHRLRDNRKPKARPMFVDSAVLVNGGERRINDVSTTRNFVWLSGGHHWKYVKDLTHPDGAPVSKVYPPVNDTVHRSQLKTFDELEDDRWYARLVGGKLSGGASGGFYKTRPTSFSDYLFYPLPTVEE